MDKIKLDNEQLDDLTMDLLPAIERRFNFQFEVFELDQVESIADLTSIIIQKINLNNDDACTSQQAFYKIRKAIRETGSSEIILPSTRLDFVFPKKNRRELVKQFENTIGFKLNILEPNQTLVAILCILIYTSFITIFISFKIGILGVMISLLSLRLLYKFGKDLSSKTVRDLITNNLSDNYLSFRSDKSTINESEVRNILPYWFSDTLRVNINELEKISFK